MLTSIFTKHLRFISSCSFKCLNSYWNLKHFHVFVLKLRALYGMREPDLSNESSVEDIRPRRPDTELLAFMSKFRLAQSTRRQKIEYCS